MVKYDAFEKLIHFGIGDHGYNCVPVYLNGQKIGMLGESSLHVKSKYSFCGLVGDPVGVTTFGATPMEAVVTYIYIQICGFDGLKNGD